MLKLDCPDCGKVLHLDESYLGGVCRCAHCGTMISVPEDLDRKNKSSGGLKDGFFVDPDAASSRSRNAERSERSHSHDRAERYSSRSSSSSSSSSRPTSSSSSSPSPMRRPLPQPAGSGGNGMVIAILAVVLALFAGLVAILAGRNHATEPVNANTGSSSTVASATSAQKPSGSRPGELTLEDFRRMAPGADDDFLTTQMNKGRSPIQARDEWAYELKARQAKNPQPVVDTATAEVPPPAAAVAPVAPVPIAPLPVPAPVREPATITELRNTLPTASVNFLEEQIALGASVSQARKAWEDKLNTDLKNTPKLNLAVVVSPPPAVKTPGSNNPATRSAAAAKLTLEDLKKSLPDADEAFLREQLAAGGSIDEIKKRWTDHQASIAAATPARITKQDVSQLYLTALRLQTQYNEAATRYRLQLRDQQAKKPVRNARKLFIPTDGLSGQWAFEGDLKDASGKDRHAGGLAKPLFEEGAGGGSALKLAALQDHLHVMNLANLPAANKPQSVGLWFNVDTLPGADAPDQVLFVLSNNATNSAVIVSLRKNGKLSVLKHGEQVLAETELTDADHWHHVAYTYDNKGHRLFLDGVLKHSTSVAPNMDAATALCIGARSKGDDPFRGLIDDVLFYNRALSTEEIGAIYRSYEIEAAPSAAPAGVKIVTAEEVEQLRIESENAKQAWLDAKAELQKIEQEEPGTEPEKTPAAAPAPSVSASSSALRAPLPSSE